MAEQQGGFPVCNVYCVQRGPNAKLELNQWQWKEGKVKEAGGSQHRTDSAHQ